MVEAQASFRTAEDLGPELQAAVLQWILSVADTKQTMGMQISHWVTGTPALEGAVGSAAITQDELGHARSLHALLRHYPGAPEGVGAENDLEARDDYFVPAGLTPRWQSWYQVIAVNVILDRALAVAIEATVDSAFAPLAGRAAKILQEERFHRMFGDNWLQRLGGRDGEVRVNLQRQIDWAWGLTDQWLGPDAEPLVALLHAHGVLNMTVAEMRQKWAAETTAVLTANGFDIPESDTDWSSWNGQYRHIADA